MTGRAADAGKSASKMRGLSREARQAAALRSNLARRKAQARARAQMEGPDGPTSEADRPDQD